MPSISERAPYHRIESRTGRSGPQNFWNTCGASRKPTMRRSRSISSCTRRTVSTMPSGSSESRKECDVESCAPIFQEPIMSSDAVFWVGVARDQDGIDGAIGRERTPKNSVARPTGSRRAGEPSPTFSNTFGWAPVPTLATCSRCRRRRSSCLSCRCWPLRSCSTICSTTSRRSAYLSATSVDLSDLSRASRTTSRVSSSCCDP
jgi:hypothetical protein